MRQTSQDGHLFADAAERFVLGESLSHEFDEITRQVREIAERLVLDFSVFTKRASEVDRGVRNTIASLADLSDMNSAWLWLAHAGFVAAV